VGQWSSPNGPTSNAAPGIGKWAAAGTSNAAGAAGADSVGQWLSAGASHGGEGGAGQSGPLGQWMPKDFQITDAMNLSDVMRRNPNISAVRFVEMMPQASGSPKIRELMTMGRSLLQQHFGR
jgi:hypothetical protein